MKIASDEASLYTAAEQLLHKKDDQINEIAQKTLEGHVVYADPAGHPFCIGWGHPDEAELRSFLAGWSSR